MVRGGRAERLARVVFDLTVLAVGFAEQHGGVSLTLIRAVDDLDERGYSSHG
jgi:hypothetical protein